MEISETLRARLYDRMESGGADNQDKPGQKPPGDAGEQSGQRGKDESQGQGKEQAKSQAFFEEGHSRSYPQGKLQENQDGRQGQKFREFPPRLGIDGFCG